MLKVLLRRKVSFVFLILQLLLSIGVCGLAIYVGFIPAKYIVPLALVCVVLFVYQIFSQLAESSYWIGRVLCLCFCALYIGGSYYILDTYATMSDIGGVSTKVDVISFYVLKDDKAQSIVDAKDYDFGILTTQDRENTDKAIADAKNTVKQNLKIKEFMDTNTQVDALYAGEVQVIILNEAFLNPILEQYKTFKKDTRKLVQHEIETKVEEQTYEDTDVTTKPFNVYISGIDLYGKIAQTSRSDVNIIATVNPLTKKILLTSTPRDYYIPLYGEKGKSVSGGVPDKLTHAGIYGIDCSINTLEKLYDIDIDYYVRVNFTSVKKIVDILGGVEVYSDFDFISDWGPHGAGTHYKFKKGMNKVNGKKALAFCRERHHFGNGDFQRGRNHQHMIEAVLNKVLSPSVLQDFSGLLKETKKMFQTSMSTKKIVSLCNMQLSDMATWKISYTNAGGTGAKKTTYSMPSTVLWICEPDYASVNKITKRINKVMNQTPEDVEKEKEKKSQAKPTLEP